MKILLNTVISCFVATTLGFSNVSLAENTNSSLTPTPHTEYELLYTLNAKHGVISLQPDNSYQLILQDIHPRVIYKIHLSPAKSGTLPMTKFLQQWQHKKSESITADLTGVQVDQNIGHQQFYQVIKLSNPQYQAKRHEITFNISFTQSDKPVNALEEMENATLFINGCEICSCSATEVSCN